MLIDYFLIRVIEGSIRGTLGLISYHQVLIWDNTSTWWAASEICCLHGESVNQNTEKHVVEVENLLKPSTNVMSKFLLGPKISYSSLEEQQEY